MSLTSLNFSTTLLLRRYFLYIFSTPTVTTDATELELARSALSSLAQQIVSTRSEIEPARYYVLLSACTRMLQSVPMFLSFMQLQSCVVMVNRLFQELALYVAANLNKSSSTTTTTTTTGRTPCHTMVLHQMLCLLSSLMQFGGSNKNAEVENKERSHRHEFLSSKRGTFKIEM